MILKLLWRNIWRNKKRTLITMASISFSIFLAIVFRSLQKGIFDNLVKNVVSFYSGYIQIHKNGYWDEQVLDNSFDYSDSLITKVKKTEHVIGAAARIESFVLASSDSATYGSLLVGTQPDEENNLTRIKSKIIKGEYLNENDENVIVAEALASKLGITVNDTIVLLGQGYQGNNAAGKFPVKAIAHYASPQLDESLIIIPLNSAQKFFSAENKITTLAINIDAPLLLEKVSEDITKNTGKYFEILTWKKIMPDIEAHIKADSVNSYIFIGILYFLIAFGIFGTILMMMAERKYELGMLMAIGMKRNNLSLMLLGETILISLIGTILGLILSFFLVKYFEYNPIKFGGAMAEAYKKFGFDPLWPASFDLKIFITQALIILSLALIIGIYPLIKIYRMEAVTSMKR